ncbi:spondin domain-containing protein [Pseudofulvibacter geojedonensis]|uniref:Spondin domain-containing protein n=1 Tax=Pseudofulvibacter geojedonensis TaxID=1123758 RepID=A0ABW3I2I2_9FLAO
MKNKLTLLKKLVVTLILISNLFLFSQTTAVYDITFTSTWNNQDHGTLPPGPHWSDLVGATHNSDFAMWNLDKKASLGIKNVAELGQGNELLNEVNTAISNGHADFFRQTSFSPNNALGIATFTGLQIDPNYPLVSLVSMIAPSPDWFIGVSAISLLDESNNWKSDFTIDVFPLDAGTDSGSSYTAGDMVTDPQENITSLVNISPFGTERIGYFTFSYRGVLSLDEFEKKQPKIFPNPATNLLTIDNLIEFEKIEMFDVTGKRVFKELLDNVSSYSFNTDRNENGVYFIKLTNKNNSSTIKKVLIL